MLTHAHSNIPHSIRGGENDAEMCLIVKNGDKARIKEALAADPVPGLAKIIEIKKLKKNFSRFDDKRTLAGAYDLFLADDRIVPYLPEALGTKFFVKKKQPVVVRVSRKDVSNAIRAVYHSTQMVVSTGACSNVKVAHLAMDVNAAVENILVATNNCAAHIPKGWNGIQSISIKTNESVALPIYNALATLAKLPPASKKQALTKRKLEEVETEVAAPSKALKKAKKETPAPAATPAKKGGKKKEAAAAPAKKEALVAKKEAKKEAAVAPAKKDAKKETPVAKKDTKKEAAAPAKKDNKQAKKDAKKDAPAAKKEAKKADAPAPKAESAKPVAEKKQKQKKATVEEPKKKAETPAPSSTEKPSKKRKGSETAAAEPAAKKTAKVTPTKKSKPSKKK